MAKTVNDYLSSYDNVSRGKDYKVYSKEAVAAATDFKVALAVYKNSLGITAESTAAQVKAAETLVDTYITDRQADYDATGTILDAFSAWRENVDEIHQTYEDIFNKAGKQYIKVTDGDDVMYMWDMKAYNPKDSDLDHKYVSTLDAKYFNAYGYFDSVNKFDDGSYYTSVKDLMTADQNSITSVTSTETGIVYNLQGGYDIFNHEGAKYRSLMIAEGYTEQTTIWALSTDLVANDVSDVQSLITVYAKEEAHQIGNSTCNEFVKGKCQYTDKDGNNHLLTGDGDPTNLDHIVVNPHGINTNLNIKVPTLSTPSTNDSNNTASFDDNSASYTIGDGDILEVGEEETGTYYDTATGNSYVIDNTPVQTITLSQNSTTGNVSTTTTYEQNTTYVDVTVVHDLGVLGTSTFYVQDAQGQVVAMASSNAMDDYITANPGSMQVTSGSTEIVINSGTFQEYNSTSDSLSTVNSSFVHDGTYYVDSNTAISSTGDVTNFGSDNTYVIGSHTYINNNGNVVDYASFDATGVDTTKVGSYDYVTLGGTLAYLNDTGDFTTFSTTATINNADMFIGADGTIGSITNSAFAEVSSTDVGGLSVFDVGSTTAVATSEGSINTVDFQTLGGLTLSNYGDTLIQSSTSGYDGINTTLINNNQIFTNGDNLLTFNNTTGTYESLTYDTIGGVDYSSVIDGTNVTDFMINAAGSISSISLTNIGDYGLYQQGATTIAKDTSGEFTSMTANTVGGVNYLDLGNTIVTQSNTTFTDNTTTTLNSNEYLITSDGGIVSNLGNSVNSVNTTAVDGVEYFATGEHTIGTYNAADGLGAASVVTVGDTDYTLSSSHIVTEKASVFNSLTYVEVDNTKWFAEEGNLTTWDSNNINTYNVTLTYGDYNYAENSNTNTLIAYDTKTDGLSTIAYDTVGGVKYFTDTNDAIMTIGTTIGSVASGAYGDKDYIVDANGVVVETNGSFTSLTSNATNDHTYFEVDNVLVSSSVDENGTISIGVVGSGVTSLNDSTTKYTHGEEGKFVKTDTSGGITLLDADYTEDNTDYLIMIEKGGHIVMYDEDGNAVQVESSGKTAQDEAWFDYLAEKDLLGDITSESVINDVSIGNTYVAALDKGNAAFDAVDVTFDPLTGDTLIDGEVAIQDDDGNLYVYDDNGEGTTYILDKNVATVGYSKMVTTYDDTSNITNEGTGLTTIQMTDEHFVVNYSDGSVLVADGDLLASNEVDLLLDINIDNYVPTSIGSGDLANVEGLSVVYSEDSDGNPNGSIVSYTLEDADNYGDDLYVTYTVTNNNTAVQMTDSLGDSTFVNVDNSEKWTIDIDQSTGDISASVNAGYNMGIFEDDDQRYSVQYQDDPTHIYEYSTDKHNGVNALEATTTIMTDSLYYTKEEFNIWEPNTWLDGIMPDITLHYHNDDGTETVHKGGLLTELLHGIGDIFTDDAELLESFAEVGFVGDKLLELYTLYTAASGVIASAKARHNLINYLQGEGVNFSDWDSALLVLADIIDVATVATVGVDMAGAADSILVVYDDDDTSYDSNDPSGILDTESVTTQPVTLADDTLCDPSSTLCDSSGALGTEAATLEDLGDLNAIVDEEVTVQFVTLDDLNDLNILMNETEGNLEDFHLDDTAIVTDGVLVERIEEVVDETIDALEYVLGTIMKHPSEESNLAVDDSYFGLMAGSVGYDSQLAGNSLFGVDTVTASTQGVTFAVVNSHIVNSKEMNLPYEDLAGGTLFSTNQDLRVNGVV